MNLISSHLLKLIILAAAMLLLSGSARLTAGKSSSPVISLDQLLRPIQIPVQGGSSRIEQIKSALPEKPAHIRITAAQMMTRLEAELNGNLEAGDELELQCKAKVASVQIPFDAEWDIYTNDEFSPDTRGNWIPQLNFEVNGELKHSWRLPIKVALFRSVHMAVHRLDRGETPKVPAVKPVVTNIYQLRGSPISSNVDLNEYELVQTVAEGRFLSWNDVNRRPDVRRGDMVEVHIEQGALSISLVAMSLESGVVGDLVSLRNVRSRQEFNGIVSGAKRVRVIK